MYSFLKKKKKKTKKKRGKSQILNNGLEIKKKTKLNGTNQSNTSAPSLIEI